MTFGASGFQSLELQVNPKGPRIQIIAVWGPNTLILMVVRP